MQDEAVQDEAVEDEAVQDEAVQDEGAQDEAVHTRLGMQNGLCVHWQDHLYVRRIKEEGCTAQYPTRGNQAAADRGAVLPQGALGGRSRHEFMHLDDHEKIVCPSRAA